MECYNKSGDFMFESMEKLKIISALYGKSAIKQQFTDRPYHALIFKIDGESVYTFHDKKIPLSKGQVLFIPMGATYTVGRVSPEESHYAVINFTASLPDCQPRLFPCSDFHMFKHIIDRLIRVLIFGSPSGTMESMSLFYKIATIIYQHERKSYCNLDKRNLIKPAIDYLENNIFDCSLKIGQLHTLCNISDTYFRKIFIAVYGIPPKKYVLEKRLAQAKNILDCGDYSYVYAVAAAVGFEDPLYFSKVFKNRYGYLPSDPESF